MEDYDVTIIKNGKQAFQVSALAGQPGQPLHSDGGIVIFPYAMNTKVTTIPKIS
ncbi:MAG: hypothetical protein WA667_05670 [Candidatus Nitrosopolaris sp.]